MRTELSSATGLAAGHPVVSGAAEFRGHTKAIWRVAALLALFVTGIAVRVGAAHFVGGGLDRAYQGDETDYARLANSVVEGRGFTRNGTPTSHRTPGLPLLLAIPVAVVGQDLLVIRIFMVVLGSLLILGCYVLGVSMMDSEGVGWTAAVVATFFPTWVIASSEILTDIPAAVAVTFMAWTLIEGYRRQALSWFAAGGLLWGTATLIRPGSLVFGLGIVAWLLIVERSWLKRLLAVLIVVIACACVLAPWSIRSTRVHGSFVLISTLGGIELYKANNEDATGILAVDHAHFDRTLSYRYSEDKYPNEVIRAQLFEAEALRFIRRNPSRFLQLCLTRLVQLWKLYSPRVAFSANLAVILSFGIALPFFLVEAAAAGWRRPPELLFLFLILCQTAVHTVFTSVVRYRLPMEPMVVVMAILGCYWVVSRSPTVKSFLIKCTTAARSSIPQTLP